MSDNNYIQENENIQSFSQNQKFWQYVYLLKHIPTGLLYVGSRSNQQFLKKFEDCYTDNYLGSSSLKEGPFSAIDTETNPQYYEKTVLKVFYDADAKKACKYEHGDNGLIMTYWNLYGKNKVLNQHCVLNDGSKVFSTAGNQLSIATKIKISQSTKGRKPTEETLLKRKKKKRVVIKKWKMSEASKQKMKISRQGKNPFYDKSNQQMREIFDRISISNKKAWENKTIEEKKEHGQKIGQKLKGRPLSDERKENLRKPKIKFHCPYDKNIERDGGNMAQYIKKYYPQLKQWSQFTKDEKEKFKVI